MMQTLLIRMTRAAALLVAVALLGACAAQRGDVPELRSNQITTEMLLDRSPLAMDSEFEDISQVDILELSPEMIAFVAEHTVQSRSSEAKLRNLIYAIMGSGDFEIIFDEKTRTARETFEDRRGNCFSFTSMFVAMARQVGLDAHYQEVEIPPLWSFVGQSFLLNQHINVHVRLGSSDVQVVDFNIIDFHASGATRVITDTRARAHYFNNIGAESMLGGDIQLALANFRQSLLEDTSFSPAWVNLGSLYRRDGYPGYAEAAYLRGLDAEQDNLVAMSNLANLYAAEGHAELAALYLEKVKQHRQKNPFYQFQLAIESFGGGDYEAAIKYTKSAIRLRDDEPRFYSLLSLSYLMSGDRDQALRWMEKAASVAAPDAERTRYQSKLNWLMRQNVKE
jgi:Flp pilus assembly protein TadD